MGPAAINKKLNEKRELHRTISTQLERLKDEVKKLSAQKGEAEQAAQAAADGLLLGNVTQKDRDAARERRDSVAKDLRNASEDLEAAKRIEPKIADEVRRLETQLGDAIKIKARKRLAELQEETASRLEDIIPELGALSQALENIGGLGALIAYKFPVFSRAAAQDKWGELRKQWISEGE